MRHILPLLILTACQDYSLVQPTHDEYFNQPSRETGVDILWVVDDSATMLEEQDLLVGSADAFISFVSNSGIDFHLGVVSTDMDVDGGLIRGEVLGPDSVGIVNSFNDAIVGAFTGSRDERGLDAASIAADPVFSVEFARKKADLEVVFFSDEDDHSTVSVDAFLADLADQRDRDAEVKVHAVVGDPPQGCVSASAAADAGTRYLDSQLATQGRRESICTDDYGAMLARVALDVVGLETSFKLTKVPDVETMQVRVNDVIVHSRRRDGWFYNPGDNTLRFDGYGVPPAGATIQATFTEWYGEADSQEVNE
jgi:hypothetical protein